MNAAEALKRELSNSSLFDKEKVLATVINGIKNNGGWSEIIYDGYRGKLYYGSYDVECATSAECEGIKEYLKSEGFRIGTAYHPASGRPYGYKAYL